MKEIIFNAIALLIVTAIIAGFDFKLRPFHLRFANPYMAIGFILIVAGMFLIYHQGTLNAKLSQP